MEKIRKLYLRTWRGLAIAVSLAIIAYLLYFHRLGSLLPGYSSSEISTYNGAQKLHDIMVKPINAPYTLIVWLFSGKLHHGILATRAISASFAVLIGLLFYAAVRTWCTYRTAFFTTILFITSAGLLHFARFGTADILQMGTLALLDLVILYRLRKKQRVLVSYLLVIVSAMLLYVPGMIWFEVIGIVALLSIISSQLKQAKKLHLGGLTLAGLICITPLVIACVRSPKLLLQVIGLPANLHVLSNAPMQLLDSLLATFLRSNETAIFWVGHAPLLDAVAATLVLIGAYYVYTQHHHRRLFMFGSLIIGFVLIALGGDVTFACIVPILYLFVAIGLDGLLSQWLTVFPRNPVARRSGVALVCLMLLFSAFYQLQTYFVAWPQAPATRQIFSNAMPQSVTIHTQ